MKKSEATYKIEFVGNRVVDEFRGDRILGRMYAVIKMLDGKETGYEVTMSTIGDWCTCPAGRRYQCKHLSMVRDFQETETDR